MENERPFISHSIDQLEGHYDNALSERNLRLLKTILNELTHRKTPRAKELKKTIENYFVNKITDNDEIAIKSKNQHSNVFFRSGPSNVKKITYKPTKEQEEAITAFITGGSLKINAYAGTGKTFTLEMLANVTSKKGQYIAFNRDIVNDAKRKFPKTVNCSTTHGLAFKTISPAYRHVSNKMTGKINANKVAELLNFNKDWIVDKSHKLKPLSQGSLILRTLQRYTQSADSEIVSKHVPRHGSLVSAHESTIKAVEEFAVCGASNLWKRMQDPNDPVPLGHDGYLKLWSLSNPIIAADFILLDEAQDTSPVVLEVLRNQPAQMIYVGDRYQQIYEWRGAVNAMEEIETQFSSLLTQSFRFGGAIANIATKVLNALGESVPIVGNRDIKSRICTTQPDTVLARTNAYTITAVIDCLDQNIKPHLVGGKNELIDMINGVQDLKNGKPSTVPDFFGFQTWDEVVSFEKNGEGEHLLTFVNLIESRGERQLMWALNHTSDEEDSDISISTAHKAKGREWAKVRLMDDFLTSKIKKKNDIDFSELRLLYVAITRAREEIEIPFNLMAMIDSK